MRYAVQASLIRTFFEHGWQGPRFDDHTTQPAVLSWLSRYRARLLAAQQQMGTYALELAAWVTSYRQYRPDGSEFSHGS